MKKPKLNDTQVLKTLKLSDTQVMQVPKPKERRALQSRKRTAATKTSANVDPFMQWRQALAAEGQQ